MHPANDIGGSVDLSQFSVTGIDRIEALRDPNSVVFWQRPRSPA